MKTVRELWNDLFDSSLENFKDEDEAIRNVSMILHILELEYKRARQYVLELRHKNEELKERSDSEQKLKCGYITNRSPLKTLSANYNVTTPVKKKSTNSNNSSLFVSDNDDIFNDQITELDINTSKENDNSFLLDDSVENFETPTSPTLNKHKKKRLSRMKAKKNNSFKDVVMNTPTPKINKSRKLKQSTLNLCNLTSMKKPASKIESIVENRPDDSDETLFLPAEHQNISKDTNVIPSDSEVINILVDLKVNAENANKKIKLDNSYDCIPEKEHNSPDFIYKREAVRKKSERMKLQGWDCPDCEKYYSTYKKKLSDVELKRRLNECSRHRDKFNPNILTPKGFWNPDFSPTQDSIDLNE